MSIGQKDFDGFMNAYNRRFPEDLQNGLENDLPELIEKYHDRQMIKGGLIIGFFIGLFVGYVLTMWLC